MPVIKSFSNKPSHLNTTSNIIVITEILTFIVTKKHFQFRNSNLKEGSGGGGGFINSKKYQEREERVLQKVIKNAQQNKNHDLYDNIEYESY